MALERLLVEAADDGEGRRGGAGTVVGLLPTNAPGFVATVDGEDAEPVLPSTWYPNTGEVVGRVGGRNVWLHRRVMGNPPGRVVRRSDDRFDNRKQNLLGASHARAVTHGPFRREASGFRGVSKNADSADRPWTATIGAAGRGIDLGSYAMAEEAPRS